METRTVKVDALTVSDARESAIAYLRGEGSFDPLRVVSSRSLGFLDFGPGGAIFRYEVQVQGNSLSETEKRWLWGDR